MLSTRQLEYLVTVVDTGSFTRAAEQLHVTQPALSHQIRALERTVGGALLERLPRAVRPTPMGRAMLPYARAALADLARAGLAARRAGGLQCGELDVACVYSVSLGVLPPVLRAWRRHHPEIHVRLLEFRHADEMREAMLAGRADLAVGPVPVGWDGPVRELGVEEFAVVLPPDDPEAGAGVDGAGVDGAGVDGAAVGGALSGRSVAGGLAGTPLDLARLADRAWVHYAPGHGLAEILDRACAAAGFTPRASVRTEQTASAPILAAAGLGPTIAPANVIPAGFAGVLRRPDPPITRTLAAYARPGPDAVTSGFLECAEIYLRRAPDHGISRLR